MAAVGKGPHFLQKNPPAEFSGYGPGSYKSRVEKVTLFIDKPQLTNALANSHTEQAFPHGYPCT